VFWNLSASRLLLVDVSHILNGDIMAVNVGRGISLIVGGVVIFFIFTIFVPVLLGSWYNMNPNSNATVGGDPGDNFTATGLSAWNMIPDMLAYGGLFLGIGIFILGVLELSGFSITGRKR
jgi:hypothetical protein